MDALKRLNADAAGTCHPTVINRARRWKALYRNDRSGRSPFAWGALCRSRYLPAL